MLGSKVIEDEELKQRVKTIAERLGAEVQEVEVDFSFPFPFAMLVGKTLLVSQTFLDTFSPEEQEFLIVRAIVYEQTEADRLGKLEAFGTVVGILSLFVLTGITVALLRLIAKPITNLQFFVACCGVGLMTLSLVGLFVSSPTFLKRRYVDDHETVDRIALSATRNLPAAESAMRKLAQWVVEDLKRNHFAASSQEALQMEQSIKRELSEDLDRLRRIAKELGCENEIDLWME